MKQKGGKIVHAWAFEGDCGPAAIVSNTFTMKWPPKFGRQMEFPEIDRAEFFDLDDDFVSITRTHEELSIVCRQELVPDDVQAEREWRCLRIVGKIDFSLVGVIAAITKVLADASISVFVMSTYDTDYFLVGAVDVDRTVEALAEAGHSVQNQ